VLLLAGCGGASLSRAERSDVADAETAIEAYAAGGSNGADYADVLHGVDRLIAIYRSKPDAEVGGETMRERVQDAASEMDASHPELARKLDRALS
jgi:hypothetical protein